MKTIKNAAVAGNLKKKTGGKRVDILKFLFLYFLQTPSNHPEHNSNLFLKF